MKHIAGSRKILVSAAILATLFLTVSCHKGEKVVLAGMVTEVGSYPYSGCSPDYLLNAGTCNYPVQGKGLGKYVNSRVSVIAYDNDGCITVTKVSVWEE